ncbi:60S acidic ribosomal protein P2-like [Haliotis rubra]|uniref:60S acidic ribosomal protein P2-like n=1 Tax=Haliotis rubra TaxID=36100 RepID=UPI001EE5C6B7|nr:60S acidic ribosomal protein P2-like [Haliotis rubra]
MRYVAAYLLAVLGGNENPSAKDIKQILNSVGVDAEEDRLALVISQLKGKDVEEVIAQGNERLATVAFGAGLALLLTLTNQDKPADDDSDSDSDGGLISLFD